MKRDITMASVDKNNEEKNYTDLRNSEGEMRDGRAEMNIFSWLPVEIFKMSGIQRMLDKNMLDKSICQI